MNCAGVQPISFKGAYKIKGEADAVGEVLWYLGKKRKQNSPGFDFIDIRLKTAESSRTKDVIASTIGMDSKEAVDCLNHHLFDLFLIKNGEKMPFYQRSNHNIDLILTENEREVADMRLGRMAEDSVLRYGEKTAEVLTLQQRLKELIKSSIHSMYEGKPIIGINPFAVDIQMRPTFIDKAPIYPAEKILEGLEAGVFDFNKGVFA